MDNQQLCIFNRKQQQVFLTALLGDGYIGITNSNSTYYSTSCKYVECYSYKIWSSETIQKWSKLQEKLKSTNIDINKIPHRILGKLLIKVSI